MVVKARGRSRQTRDNYALSVAIGFTAVVALVWLYHAPSRIVSVADGVIEGAGPITNFFDQVGEQVATVRDAIPEEGILATSGPTSTKEKRTWSTHEDYTGWSLRAVPTTTVGSSTAVTSTTSATTSISVIDTEQSVRIVTAVTTSTSATSTRQTP